MIELGVFLPVINNGWVISTAAPQYQPTYAMNKAMTLLAETEAAARASQTTGWHTPIAKRSPP